MRTFTKVFILFLLNLIWQNHLYSLEDYSAIITIDIKSDVSCHGLSDGSASFILVGTGPFNYNLVGVENGSTTAVVGAITFNDLSAGNYTLIVEDERLLLPSTFDTLNFTINQPAPLAINPDITNINCNNPNGSVDLNISGGSGIYTSLLDGLLVNLGIDEIVEVSLGTHLFKITDSNGCETEEEVTVGQTPDPVVSFNGNLNLGCLDQLDLNATVNGGGGSNLFAWATNDGSILNSLGGTATIDAAGTYSVTVTDINGCTSEDQVMVSADITLPDISLSSQINLGCQSSSNINVNVANGVQVSWETDNGQIIGSANGSSIEVGGPGVYVATAFDPSTGCESSKSTTVTADIVLPNLNLASTLNLGCLSQTTIQSNVATDVQVTWETEDGSIVGSVNGTAITVNAPGTYVAVATNLLGCQTTDEIVVTADIQLPSLNLATDVNLGCLANVNLDANVGSGTSVAWLTADGHIFGTSVGSSITVDQPGTYTAIATNSLGCKDSAAINVYVDVDLPSINLVSEVNLGCLASIDLNANVGSGTSVLWLTANGNIIGTSLGSTITVSQAGTYTAIATNSIGCQDSAQIVVTADISLPSINLGSDINLGCNDLIDISANTGSGINVTWIALEGNISGNTTGNQISVDQPGTYMAIATNAIGCQDTDQINVFADINLPVIDLGSDLEIGCNGSLTLIANLSSSLNIDLHWSTLNGGHISGSTNGSQVIIDQPGTYIATATNVLTQCAAADTIIVSGEVSLIDLDLGADLSIGCGESLTIAASMPIDVDLNLEWTTINGHITAAISDTEISVDLPGLYIATATDPILGCTISDTLQIFGENPFVLNIGPDTSISCSDTLILQIKQPSNLLDLQWIWSTLDGHLVGDIEGQEIGIDQPGTYIVVAENTLTGCSSSDTIIVGSNDFTVDLGPDQGLDCQGVCVIESNVQGVDAPQFQWKTENGHILGSATGSTITVDKEGSYQLIITDSETGCMASDIMYVQGSLSLTIDGDNIANLACGSTLTTSAQVIGSGDLIPDWYLDGDLILEGSSQIVIHSAGMYIAKVSDSLSGCTLTDTLLVVETTPDIVLESLGSPDCGQSMLLHANTSGSTVLEITWTNGEGVLLASDTNELAVLDTGLYIVTVSDPSGTCKVQDSLSIVDLGFRVSLGPDLSLNCGGNVTVSASITNGIPTSMIWKNALGEILGNEETLTIENAGTYIVVAQDLTNGCVTTDTIIIKNSDWDISLGEAQYTIPCGETQLIQATVHTQDSLSYLWSTIEGEIIGSTTESTIIAGRPGLYTLSVENLASGCIATSSVVVNQEDPGPEIEISGNQILDCSGINELQLIVSGQSELEIEWQTLDGRINQTDGHKAWIGAAGTYIVHAKIAGGGCASSVVIQIFENDDCGDIEMTCCRDTTLSECSPYYFQPPSVDTSINYTVTQVSGLCSGSVFPVGKTEIVFIISYETGDFEAVSWFVTVDPYQVVAEITEPTCFNASDGHIRLILPAEWEAFQLRWNTDEEQFGSEAINLRAGTYTVSGLSAGGCIINQSFHLCQPDSLTISSGFSISATDDLSDGAINITIAGGTSPYRYEWYQDSTLISTDEDLYFMPAGIYTLKVTDLMGCSQTWDNLEIAKLSSKDALSLFDQVQYPNDMIRYLKVFPNPSAEEVHLKLELEENAAISVSLADQMGHLMENKPSIYSDNQEYNFHLKDYVPGVYHLVIKIDERLYVKKIFILN
ncbi:MAG: T9SS type A sorting domain-containing protein [Saprospiraceae bacterium]|nr:T9SS type A sorting domain-containing protein [Saprospiraceae bacterium]